MKKTYITPTSEIIEMKSEPVMEVWSVDISNDPGEAIGPGEENDIGAKRGLFDDLDEWGGTSGDMWTD